MKKLNEAVQEIIAEAQAAFSVSDDRSDIKASTSKLMNILKTWQAKDKLVTTAIIGLLKVVRSNCDHKGAQRGYNERDGDWMNPCPHCGDSK